MPVIDFYNSRDLVLASQDIFTGIIVAIILGLSFLLVGKIKYSGRIYRYFAIAVFLRIIFSFLFVILTANFIGGDSMMYYTGARQIAHADWSTFFNFLSSFNAKDWTEFNWQQLDNVTRPYLPRASNLIVSKIAALFVLLFKDSFTAITITFGLLGFIGFWKIYILALKFFPYCPKYLAYGILFFPSSIYWTSGIGKDALAIFGLGLFLSSFYTLFFKKKLKLFSLISLIIGAYLVFLVKSYILIFFILSLFFYMFIVWVRSIKNRFLKTALFPFILFVALIAGYSFIDSITGTALGNKFNPENLLEEIATHQSAFDDINNSGSNFSIGDFDPSLLGLITIFPKAVIAALYRPYIWEASSPIMLFIGIENLLITFISLFLFLKLGFFKIFRIIFANNYLFFCLFIAIIFGGLIGISTANFGSLSRYRLPCIPFFFTILAVLYQITKIRRVKRPII